MATRPPTSRIKAFLRVGFVRVANLSQAFILAPRLKGSLRLQPLPVTVPAALPSVRRGRNR